MNGITGQELFHLLNQRTRLLAKEVNHILKEYELYTSQWSILFCINRFGPMSQTEIWRYLNVEAPTVTRTLVRLEKSGWIVRKLGSDKRERIIELTVQAKEKLPHIKQAVNNQENSLIESLTMDEKTQLHYLLGKIGQSGENSQHEGKTIGKNLD